MKYILYIENDAGETLTKVEAPTADMLIEKAAQWERANSRVV